MVFSSDHFLLVFLPATYLVFLLVRRFGTRYAVVGWLIAASLVFYGWWNPNYLALLLASVVANFALGRILHRFAISRHRGRGVLLAAGIAGNLATIGYYKYAGFFATTANSLFTTHFDVGDILLPLAISFFTFQQIAFLVDSYKGETRIYEFPDYCLYVVFFPQLIAGPIVYHREAIPQYQGRTFFATGSRDFSIGLSMLVLGLAKKVLLADNLAVHANVVFDGVARGETIDPLTAWSGALAYTFQLYFDFSGYSDMAIGLARLFGVRLPFNFNSPYKATSIIDFWRRWHMTLSRFLRQYLYIPLGGNRRGRVRRYGNLLIVMMLGGLWHGAGWTFVFWGVLHGLFLCVNHAWLATIKWMGLERARQYLAYRVAAWGITFASVVVGWVFFRATNLDAALSILSSMSQPWRTSAGGVAQAETWDLALIAIAFAIAMLLPNTQTWMRLSEPLARKTRTYVDARLPRASLQVLTIWQPRAVTAMILGTVAYMSLYALRGGSEFLYFRF